MAVRLTGDPARVHFSFTTLEGDRSTALPPTFENTVEFNPSSPSASDVARLAAYIREHGITTVFGLDIDVNSSYLTAIRRAGVRKIISYWGAPMSSANGGMKLVAKRLEVALLRRSKPDHFIFESEAMRSLGVNGRGLS